MTDYFAGVMIVSGFAFTIINLLTLAINVKLYTEILKDKKFDSRAEHSQHDGGRKL